MVILLMLGTAIVTVIGDYFLKVASQGASLRWAPFAAGAALYASSAVGWVFGMRRMQLATLGAVFSVTMVLCMVGLGTIVFGESLTRREILGITLAGAAL